MASQTVDAPAPPRPMASARLTPIPRRTPAHRMTPAPRPIPTPSQATMPPPASAGLPLDQRTPFRAQGLAPDRHRSCAVDLFLRISSMLDVYPTCRGVAILGAHWNKSNNVIVSFPHRNPNVTLLDLRPDLRAALGLAELLVSGVPARFTEGAPTFSDTDLATSLTRNPAFSNVVIPRQPQWIRNPEKIAGAYSSTVLSVEINPKSKNRRPAKGATRTPARDSEVQMMDASARSYFLWSGFSWKAARALSPTLPSRSTRPLSAPRTPHKDKAPAPAPAPATLPRPPAHADLPPRPTTAPPKPKVSALVVSSPIWLVVRFGGNPPEELCSKPQTELYRKVSSTLEVHPTIKGVTMLGAHWNKSGNIIISFPDDVPQNIILALRPSIRAALGIAESVAISFDTAWAKMLVSSVPAPAQPGAPVFAKDDIATSFALNPEITKLSNTRPPRWICNPSNIAGAHSSFVFAFDDPDGSIARRLTKTSLFAFGAPDTIKRWQENAKARNPTTTRDPRRRRRAPPVINDVPMAA
ncbi:hypothetical protein RSAG8_06629, partial [Rhizoctonia solani AG-8 WAC10335]